jgi:hypothetical protein
MTTYHFDHESISVRPGSLHSFIERQGGGEFDADKYGPTFLLGNHGRFFFSDIRSFREA